MIITKKALPRRTFLRGVGATLALPLLDAMIPAATVLAKTPAKPVPRARIRPGDDPAESSRASAPSARSAVGGR